MKKISPIVFITSLFISLSFVLYSCSNDEITTSDISPGLTGQWQFTITPLYHYIDTTMLKGKNGYNFTADPSINDEIYLYESNNQIRGFAGPIEYRGLKTDSIRLSVFEPVDGRFGVDTSMIKSAEMVIKQNSMGFLEGTAKIVLDRDTTGVIFDTYKIFGRKTGNITTDNINNLRNYALTSWSQKICDVAGDIMSTITSLFTGGAFRPMANCWGDADGGGFYVFGNNGPGSLFPVWTQTCYYPLEWSACKVRIYNFEFNYGGSVMGLSEMEDIVRGQEVFLSHIGLPADTVLINWINDFYNTYGNFALVTAYNMETRGGALYVIVENGSTNATSHVLPHTIIEKINPLFSGGFTSASGRNISDSWHMRRSDFFVCNTSLLFCYLFGTAKVNFN